MRRVIAVAVLALLLATGSLFLIAGLPGSFAEAGHGGGEILRDLGRSTQGHGGGEIL
jgi:hypothetical protein